MTSLLTPPSARLVGATGSPPRRPLAISAAAAGLASPATALLLLWAVGLVGWFAADGGGHGTTRSVLRVAGQGWLLAHGAHLTLADGTVVTATPLGLTLACLLLAYRYGRWAGETSEVEDLRTAGLGVVVLAGAYGLVALVAGVAASVPAASPGLRTAFLGGAVVGALGGGAGVLRGAGLAGRLRARAPASGLSVGYATLVAVGSLTAAGALLAAVAVAVRGAAAANVAEQLRLDVTGSLLSLLLLAALTPNIALLSGAYVLGPGFAVGQGTVVAPTTVVLGPVPTLPVLAGLPDHGWAPGWMVTVQVVPIVCGVLGGLVAARLHPTMSYAAGGLRGLATGLAGAMLFALLAWQAGGAVGPGRMSVVGVDMPETLLAGLLLLGPSAVVGGVAGVWWTRRRLRAES
jgi:hypothetical protein